MNHQPESTHDSTVPADAVAALNAAQQRAMQSGRTIVLVRNRQVVEIAPDGTQKVIRTLPPRIRVNRTIKRARR